MTEHRVVILGEARIDEIRDPGGMREGVGGDAIDLASALLGHGLSLTVVAPVGEDADGERIRDVLNDRGVRLVAVPAPEGTLRRALVRDRSGAEIEVRREERAFADTRRSLAAEAEADVVVDLRQGIASTVVEERDEVLRALGLTDPGAHADAGAPAGASTDADAHAPVDTTHLPEPEEGASAVPDSEDSAERGEAEAAGTHSPAGEADGILASPPPSVPLLPAPIVAGTARHAPVRLLPDPPAAHAPAPDWHGLEARISRIAT
ncbi:hypothetical protein [Microbacterium sp. MMO-10]|uniref:hypothetical protein n=1 Tax=Microbacterium sp. MMO-10 TaxID=3081272 RepID=UPI003016EDAE